MHVNYSASSIACRLMAAGWQLPTIKELMQLTKAQRKSLIPYLISHNVGQVNRRRQVGRPLRQQAQQGLADGEDAVVVFVLFAGVIGHLVRHIGGVGAVAEALRPAQAWGVDRRRVCRHQMGFQGGCQSGCGR